MRYHVKERAWSLTEDFVVKDDTGNAVYEIRGKFFHVGDNLVLFDRHSHQELIHIKQHMIALSPKYDIYKDRQHYATVHEQFKFFGERFKVKGENGAVFHIDGSVWRWHFTISDEAGNLMAQVSHQLSPFHQSYAVDVAQGVDAPFMIALAIVLELVKTHHEVPRD